MKKSDKTPEDLLNISYSMALRHKQHPVYPTVDDYVQESMVALEGFSAEKHPLKTIYYCHMNTFARKYMPEYNKDINKKPSEEMYRELPDRQENLVDKIALKEFFNWLPEGRAYDMFYRNCILGEGMTSIANSYGLSRQALHVAKTKLIVKYQKEKVNRK